LALGDQILPGLLILAGRLDGDAPLVLVIAAEPHRAGNLGNDRRFLRPPRLEQLRHPRQTAGDVARLGAFGRDTGDDVTGADMHAGIDRDDGVHGQQRAGVAAAAEFEDLAVLALDHQRRAQVLLAAGGGRTPIDDHALGDAGRLVERLGQRLTFDQVLIADRAVDLGEDRPRIRVPLGDALAALDVIALVDLQPRAIGDAVHGALGAVGITDGNDEVAAHRDQVAVRVLGDVAVLDRDGAFKVQLDERLPGDLRRAADMERAHGELGARLADRLRGDDAHRLAHIDRGATGKIAPVALAADAAAGLAGEHGADLDLLHAGVDQLLDLRLLEQGRIRHQDVVTRRVAHVFGRGTAEDAACQRGDDGTGIDDRPHLDAARRAAVLIGDDAVLR